MEDLFQKFKKQFINEIQGLLETLETDLLSLEKDPGEAQLIDSVFRAMHTIKGTSAMYGCKVISDFTHHLENIYQIIRDTNLKVDHGIIDISLASLDHIRNLIVDEKLELPHNIARNEELLKVIGNYSLPGKPANEPVKKKEEKPKKAEKKPQSWYILLKTDEQIYFRGVSLVNILSDLASLGTYYIHRIAALCNNETETWGLF